VDGRQRVRTWQKGSVMKKQQGRMWAVLAGVVVVCGLMQQAQAAQEYQFVDLAPARRGLTLRPPLRGPEGSSLGTGEVRLPGTSGMQ
jgi:hypothetical protein